MPASDTLLGEFKPGEIVNLISNAHQEDVEAMSEERISQTLTLLEQNQAPSPDECAAGLAVIKSVYSSMNVLPNNQEESGFSDLRIRCETLAVIYSLYSLEDMLGWLNDLGLSLDSRFEELGDINDLKLAIEYREKAVNMSPEGHERLPELLNALGISYLGRFNELEDEADLSKAIQCISNAVSMLSEDDSNLPQWENNLGVAFLKRFQLSKQLEDIDKAIASQSHFISLTPAESEIRTIVLGNLGRCHYHRFLNFRQSIDIKKAIEYQSLVISLCSEENELYAPWLNQLGDYYRIRFEHFREPEDIDEAIKYHLKAVSLSDDETNTEYPMWMNSLGDSYHDRFILLGETPDLDQAIEYLSRAASLVDPDDESILDIVQDLSLANVSRFERFGKREDIELAIQYQSHVILIAPRDHMNMPLWLKNLADSYDACFDHFGDYKDIETSIELYWQALLLTPQGHDEMPEILQQLGCAYCNRFEQLGELDDADRAIKYQSRALELLPERASYRVMTFGNLGNSYVKRFERSGKLEDLQNAIEYQSKAVALTPKHHTKRQLWLGNLGNSYWVQYEHFGKLEDVDMAIELLTEAISLTSPDHGCITLWLSNLGVAHWNRFERLEEAEDIDKAIVYHSQALELASENTSHRARFHNNLGNSYSSRFERLNHSDDIDKAIMHQTMAVSITPLNNASRAHWLGNLGDSYWTRAERLGKQEDINKAIDCHLETVGTLPPGHASLPLWLVSLGKSYASRFMHEGSLSDIESAIEHHTVAVNLTPPSHGDAPEWLYSLGRSHLICLHRFPEVGSLEKTMQYFKRSAQSTVGSPYYMFRSACHWAQLAAAQCMPEHLIAYQRAMDLVPQLVWLGTSIEKRYSDVPKLGDLALEAAMAAISVKEYSTALEWLEQGRSIVWNQMLQLRTPLDHLSSFHPALAERLGGVAAQLHNSASMTQKQVVISNNGVPLERPDHKHHRIAEEYERIINQVRQLEGFGDFLLPKKFPELLRATRSGPVVVVNVHPSRCDALILRPGCSEVSCIPLPLSHKKVGDLCDQLRYMLSNQDIRHRDTDQTRRPFFDDLHNHDGNFESMLKTLWYDLTKPVLDFLGYKLLSGGDLPRITWCTTGPLSFLPLHASGCYDQPGERVFHYAISSYTPTVTAITSPTTFQPSRLEHVSLLAVGQEETPGCSTLPNTVRELDCIRLHSGELSCYTQLEGHAATIEAVLTAMETHDWVHLACHAHQNGQKPLESGFFLQNGKLTLAMLSQKAFKNKGLAFLSACQTATGDRTIADEAVHLASGMLVAGYPSVVATMWSIVDADAPSIADIFYGILRDKYMDHSNAACALHAAASVLRANVGEGAFGRWVPFIHVGL